MFLGALLKIIYATLRSKYLKVGARKAKKKQNDWDESVDYTISQSEDEGVPLRDLLADMVDEHLPAMVQLCLALVCRDYLTANQLTRIASENSEDLSHLLLLHLMQLTSGMKLPIKAFKESVVVLLDYFPVELITSLPQLEQI